MIRRVQDILIPLAAWRNEINQIYHSLPSTKQRHDLRCAEIKFARSGHDEDRESHNIYRYSMASLRKGEVVTSSPGIMESGNPHRELEYKPETTNSDHSSSDFVSIT
jgi:hypothetical protein